MRTVYGTKESNTVTSEVEDLFDNSGAENDTRPDPTTLLYCQQLKTASLPPNQELSDDELKNPPPALHVSFQRKAESFSGYTSQRTS